MLNFVLISSFFMLHLHLAHPRRQRADSGARKKWKRAEKIRFDFCSPPPVSEDACSSVISTLCNI